MKHPFLLILLLFITIFITNGQDIELDVQNKQIVIKDGNPKAILKSNNNNSGELILFDNNGIRSLLTVNSTWKSGEMQLFDSADKLKISISAAETTTKNPMIQLYDNDGTSTITINGDYAGKGRVTTQELEITGGADLAEHFEVNPNGIHEIIPGMVVVIDPQEIGKLMVSTKSYDKRIAGIISGANGVGTGLIMRHAGSIADGRFPIALTGRAYVKACDENGKIEPGDFLTTSSIPGYAMRAGNKKKAKGAIVGKAMSFLNEQSGFVLVLINLQ